jgi:acyl-CoA thioesterase
MIHRDGEERRSSASGDRGAGAAPAGAGEASAEEVAKLSAAAMYDADRASQLLGIEITAVAPGRATARMRVTDSMINGHDIAHGGYVFLLADTVFAFACNSYGRVSVAASADIVFVMPARLGDELVAEAAERVRYGRSGVYDVTVRRSGGEVVAEFRGRSRSLDVSLIDPPASP